MPNWWVGTIKMSGKIENLKRFLKEGCTPDQEGEVINIQAEGEKKFSCSIPGQLLFIEGTNRNFINSSRIDFRVEEVNSIGTLSLDFMAAWTLEVLPYIKISKTYGIDLCIESFERQIGTVIIQVLQERE